MTTTRFVTERVVVQCDGASLVITTAGDDVSARAGLCVELMTNDGDDDADLAPYCPELAAAGYPRPVGHAAARSRGRGRIALAVAAAAVALLAFTTNVRGHGTSASTGASVPVAVPPTSRTDADSASSRALVAAASDLAGRCTEMIHAASTALGTTDAGLVRTLVKSYRGRTLNDALRQELTDARAALVARISRGAVTSQQTLVGLTAFDSAMAAVDATPCSGPPEGRTQ